MSNELDVGVLDVKDCPLAKMIKLKGEINKVNSISIEEALKPHMESGTKNIIMDFSQVSFIDSSGTLELIKCDHELNKLGGLLILININENIKEIFNYIGLSRLVIIRDSLEKAIKRINE